MKNLEDYLDFMEKHGVSVFLSYDSEMKLWTCHWTAHGRQYCGISRNATMAAVETISTAGLRLAGATTPTTAVLFNKAMRIGGEHTVIELAHAAMRELDAYRERRMQRG